MVGGATAIAHGLTTVAGCAARLAVPAEAPAGADQAKAAVLEAMGDCLQAGELCQAHCLRLLGSGDTSMAACSQAVTAMLAVCGAVSTLVALDNAHRNDMLRVCLQVCADCEAACRPHAGHHAECGACAEACARSQAVVRAMLG